jgi:hypothetical protein
VATDDVHVACADGELVTLSASGGPPKRIVNVARDLRDVVVTPFGLVVSTFRNAEVIRLAADGSVQAQSNGVGGGLVAHVAWRMLAVPDGRGTLDDDPGFSVMLAAQRTPSSSDEPPPAPPAYYGLSESPCAVGGPATLVADRRRTMVVPTAVLPIDLATDGDKVMIVSAGNAYLPGRPQVVSVERAEIGNPCGVGAAVQIPGAEITSVVYQPQRNRFYALSREPAQLVELEVGVATDVGRIALSSDSHRDTGHAIFHASAGQGGVACASCHPEGRDDGHAWRSISLGARRTPSLVGTVAGTAPYHWNGEAPGLDELMTMTFTERMRGPSLLAGQKSAISGWLGELPPLRHGPAATAVLPAIARGRAVFESERAGCGSCHSGTLRTNNASIDVGTGGTFQVPSLIGVVHRAPYLHDGSRPHLRAILDQPHGGAVVVRDEIDDLVAFLDSL